jgi:hypothetical protein
MKPAAVTLLLAVPLFATSAQADTVTTQADTLVVVTPNAPVIVQQGGPAPAGPGMQPPGAGEPPPVVAPAPAAGPQNEDWSNVSHINGAPVKVGERGDYLYKFKKTNISANPFGVFFGYYDIAVSRALGQNLAASVAISGWDLDSGYTQGFQLSATLPLYFRRTFSGPYLEGGLLLRTDTSGDSYETYGASYSSGGYSDSWVGPQLLLGWQWTFDSGLNLAMAFGVAKKLEDTGSNDPDANGYFRVGYAF